MTYPTVTILDCGHGNLASVTNAVRALGGNPVVTREPEHVRHASCLVFPGQGTAPAAMRSLRESCLDQAFLSAVREGVPTLGICLGMQLALDSSGEGPSTCLGLIEGRSIRFQGGKDVKVPQIGWNAVRHRDDALFAGIDQDSYFYFVHSYFCEPGPDVTIGWTGYGTEYCSALHADSFWATQFHPEKSGKVGLRLLANFLALASRTSHR